MKKTFTAIIAAAATVAALSLCACSEPEKVDQANDMKLLAAYQNADASVYVTADLSKQNFSAISDGYMYSVQASIDGGVTWSLFNSISIDANTGATAEIPVLYYNYDFNLFTLGDNSGNKNSKVTVSAGDEITITLRFAETDYANASAATESIKYTVKSPSIYGGQQTSVDYTSIAPDAVMFGGIQFENVFVKEQNGNYVLKKYAYDKDEYIITKDLDASLSNAFEYKFFKPNDESGDNEYNVWYGAEEDVKSGNTGWTDYNAQTGISAALCDSHKLYEYNDAQSFDDKGNLIESYRQRRLVAPILIRLKETPTTVRSVAMPVYLLMSEWERVE